MKRVCLILLAASFAGALPLPAARQWTVAEIQKIPVLGDPQISPDGRMFAYTRRAIQGNVWVSTVYIAPIPAGPSKAVAKGTRPRWSPDSTRLAYSDGQVHIFDLKRQTTSTATHAPKPVGVYHWTPDGRAIAYLSSDPGPAPDPIVAGQDYKYSRLYIQPLTGGDPRRITTANRQVVAFSLSPDGTRAVYSAQPTPRNRDVFDSDIYEIDLRTLADKPVVVQPGRDGDPSYSPDGKWIAFHSQRGTLNYFTARDVALIPTGGGAIRYITEHPNIPLDVFRGGNSFSWSPDSKQIYFVAGWSTHDFLVREDLASGHIEQIADLMASPPSFTPDLQHAVFLKASRSRPPEVTLLEGTREKPLTSVGDSLAGLPEVHSKTISWKSKDGLRVEGVLWLPFNYTQGKRVPLLVELHGGPTGTAMDAFPIPRTYPTEAYLQQGFAILAPNFRGSTNYGPEFRLKNIDSQGFGDFDDVMTGIDSLVAQGVADPDRLGVMGWSYGGFLCAWTIGHTTRFKAASVGAPASDWITYYGQSDGPRSTLLTYFGGNPWDHPEAYERHSPRGGLPNIRTPTELQVGTEDINHNVEIYSALVDHNVPVEYALYPREPHGFLEPAHQKDVMERNLRWFTRWITP